MTLFAARLGALGIPDAYSGTDLHLPVQGNLASLHGASLWLNSHPLSGSDLRGKVVLIDFCTYTCINWQRQLPYIRAWAAKYRDHGLIVIGVHTPEFSFEKDVENVRRALQQMSIEYPIAIDSNCGIWHAFDNQYWPALYFADAQGHIRHHVLGEGQCEQSERILQQLLTEAGNDGITHHLVSVHPSGAEVQADWKNLHSQENYVGYERTEILRHLVERCRTRAMSTLDLSDWGSISGLYQATGSCRKKLRC